MYCAGCIPPRPMGYFPSSRTFQCATCGDSRELSALDAPPASPAARSAVSATGEPGILVRGARRGEQNLVLDQAVVEFGRYLAGRVPPGFGFLLAMTSPDGQTLRWVSNDEGRHIPAAHWARADDAPVTKEIG